MRLVVVALMLLIAGATHAAAVKKLLLAGIAALFLATGAQAEEPPGHQTAFDAFASNTWRFNDYKMYCTCRV